MTAPVNDRYEDAQGASLLAIDQYYRDIAWTKESPLSEEEEAKHFSRVARARAEPSNAWLQNVAKHSRDALVEAYQPFVLSMARKTMHRFSNVGCMELLDLANEGNIGLLRGLLEHDLTVVENPRRYLLSTALHAMYVALRDRGAFFRFSGGVVEMVRDLDRAKARLFECLGRSATYSELADELGVSVSEIAKVEGYSSCRSVKSLQGLVEEEDCTDYYEYKSVFVSSDPEDVERSEENGKVLRRALEVVVTPHQREVISQRFGFGESAGELSRRDLAAARGVVKHVVADQELHGLRRLRDALELQQEQGRIVCRLKEVYATEDYYTLKEVARLLGAPEMTVRGWRLKGRLPGAISRKTFKNIEWLVPKQVVHDLIASDFSYVPRPRSSKAVSVREEVSA